MPRLREETVGTGDRRWLGSTHGIYNARTSTLDIPSFTKATHYPDGFIRSGQPVNCADESAVAPWTGAAGEKLGFVLTDQQAVDPKTGNAYATAPAAVLRHGIVNVDHLPVAFTIPTAAGNFTFVGTGA